MGKLTAAKLKALTKPGMYSDGGTLFHRVAPGGSKSWNMAKYGQEDSRVDAGGCRLTEPLTRIHKPPPS